MIELVVKLICSYIITETYTEVAICQCNKTSPVKAYYNYISEVLTVGLNQSLTDDTPIEISYCNNGAVEKYLNQTCSTIDVSLSLQIFNNLTLIGFPAACNQCEPPLDYTIYMAIDLSQNGEDFICLYIICM